MRTGPLLHGLAVRAAWRSTSDGPDAREGAKASHRGGRPLDRRLDAESSPPESTRTSHVSRCRPGEPGLPAPSDRSSCCDRPGGFGDRRQGPMDLAWVLPWAWRYRTGGRVAAAVDRACGLAGLPQDHVHERRDVVRQGHPSITRYSGLRRLTSLASCANPTPLSPGAGSAPAGAGRRRRRTPHRVGDGVRAAGPPPDGLPNVVLPAGSMPVPRLNAKGHERGRTLPGSVTAAGYPGPSLPRSLRRAAAASGPRTWRAGRRNPRGSGPACP